MSAKTNLKPAAVQTLMRQPRAAAARQRESLYSSRSLSAHVDSSRVSPCTRSPCRHATGASRAARCKLHLLAAAPAFCINLRAILNRLIRFGQHDDAVSFEAIHFLLKASFKLPTYHIFLWESDGRYDIRRRVTVRRVTVSALNGGGPWALS
ncbi:hypothetical protein T492DRAFT_10470 [Pavlovales sp. CCMP2436]|nr:hypothetical protein T492DRAFT_10470 [Pavlovales sp. CCMP2436]